MISKMRLQFRALMISLLIVEPASAAKTSGLKTNMDKASYGLGVEMARSFTKAGADINLELLNKGLKDGLAGGRLLMPEKELRPIVRAMQAEMQNKTLLSQRDATLENKRKGEAFLAGNKAKQGVVTLPSGVQYKILKAGKGKRPTDADFVECHYRGNLLDGTEFDSSDPGKPSTMKVSSLIPGWKEALKLMPVGSKWQLFIPSELAYGIRGVGSEIGPNEALTLEVELLAVKPAEAVTTEVKPTTQ